MSTRPIVKLVTATPDAETMITYIARVSNPTFLTPDQQSHEDVARLIKYCMTNGHWSIFEMANLVIEVNTNRAIAAQILRHRSFSFQEFSQRYQDVTMLGEMYTPIEPRRQDVKNRQNSFADLPDTVIEWWNGAYDFMATNARKFYEQALQLGIAKESARFLLPMFTATKMYINGNIRSWITYFMARLQPGVQKEHRDVAVEAFKIFEVTCPIVGRILRDELEGKGIVIE